ncbi:GIY-YIG nuclease family protein [bacterium]|nr:GIY-YIG nuclease family protein [bacterium]
MIRACPNCNAKNRLPTDGDANQLGRPVCASCGNYLFPENSENETNSFQTGEIGHIYILAHKSGKIVKVGETSRDPSKRHKEYVAEYKLRDFELFRTFKVPLNARKDIEKLAHQKLQHLRLSLLEQGGAREIFACDTATAVKAIEEAEAESEINRIEQERQRQQQIKRDKLAKAKAKYDEQLEKFIEGWLREWEGSHWVKSKRSVLAKFVTETPFEEEKTQIGAIPLFYGLMFLLLGVFFVFSTLTGKIESPEPVATLIMIFTFFGLGFLCLKIKSTITEPNKEALAKKVAMEDEIETSKQTTIATARNDFEKHFTLENFYE